MYKSIRTLIIGIVLIVLVQELGNSCRTMFSIQFMTPAEIGCTTDMECYQLTGVNY